MKMSITSKEGRYTWGFVLTSSELYQMVCHIVASLCAMDKPHLLKNMECFRDGVIHTVHSSNELSEEELNSCQEPLLRMIFVECKRLNLNLMEESRKETQD